jgi:Putative beta-barrel porin-2, OmpL-like. bbp2
MKQYLFILFSFFTLFTFAQKDSSAPALTISGYLEVYYGYDFGKPDDHNRPAFIYSHNRHNEVNLNLGFIKASWQTDKVRANLALAAGTYMNANLAAEPGVLQNIFEANAGVKISGRRELWVDAGIFSSHLGFESAIGKDCQTLTRSIMADNSPYYEAGVKVSYTSPSQKWFLSGLLLNGWQRIQRPDGNNTPAFGHQLTYKPNARVTLNSSSFIGNDKPDSVKQMRYFHNFYGIFQLNDKFSLTTGFDIGAEQKYKGSKGYNSWYTPVLIIGFQPHEKHHFAGRAEYYHDPEGVIISSGTPDGFKTLGFSINYDYAILKNFIWRSEVKMFNATDKIFSKDGEAVNNNFCMTTSFALSF